MKLLCIGTKEYSLLTINDFALRKYQVYRKILMYFNIPILSIVNILLNVSHDKLTFLTALPVVGDFIPDFSHPKANTLYVLF